MVGQLVLISQQEQALASLVVKPANSQHKSSLLLTTALLYKRLEPRRVHRSHRHLSSLIRTRATTVRRAFSATSIRISSSFSTVILGIKLVRCLLASRQPLCRSLLLRSHLFHWPLSPGTSLVHSPTIERPRRLRSKVRTRPRKASTRPT